MLLSVPLRRCAPSFAEASERAIASACGDEVVLCACMRACELRVGEWAMGVAVCVPPVFVTCLFHFVVVFDTHMLAISSRKLPRHQNKAEK